MADAQAPAWWNGWRAGVTLTAARDNRLGYYGIGNETRYSSDSAAAAGAYYYRVSRKRLGARVTVQRRLVGPLRLLAGGAVTRNEFRALPGASIFRTDLNAGALDPRPFNDHVVRVGLVVDTRDSEVDPHAGVLLETLFASGNGYTRTTAGARVHVRPARPLVVAGRLVAEGTGGTPPLAAQQEVESSEQSFAAVGGYRSLRGFYDGRFTGRGKLLGGLEARYAVRSVGDAMELKIVAFFDAARVFGVGEDLRLTTHALHRGGGAEVALRLLRNSLVVTGYGHGSEGGQVFFATSWSY